MRSRLGLPVLTVLMALGLTACGGSDDDNSGTFPDAYLQFYNGSDNSALTSMREADGGGFGSASYGDSTSLFNVDGGDLDLEFFRTDSDDQELIIQELTVNMQDGRKTLVMMSGDFANPTFTPHQFEREELEDHFRLFAIALVSDQSSYDLYMSDAGAPFEAANLLGTINYEGFQELTYWDGDDDSDDFDEGDYTVYLTAPGSSEVIFESPTVDFAFATEYVMVIRGTTGAVEGDVQVDLVLNSSSVTSLADTDATAQFRIYNSLNGDATMDVTLDGNDDNGTSLNIASNTITDFTEVEFGDYRLSATSSADANLTFNNRLVTLNQGESKAIVLYQEEDGDLTSLSFSESTLPQEFDKEVFAVNLVPDFADVDLYFVRNDETIESARFLISSIDFGESKSLTLPSDFYELVAVFDDNEDTQVLLDRTAITGINEDQNYIISIELDESSPTGYKIQLLF